MKAVVSEPVVEYQTRRWSHDDVKFDYSFQFVDIVDGYAEFLQPTVIPTPINIASRKNSPKKIALSSLRGKGSKQTKEEIDQQLKELRDEWERDI